MTEYDMIYCDPKDKSTGLIHFKCPPIIRDYNKNVTKKNQISELMTSTFKMKLKHTAFCSLTDKKSEHRILEINTINDYNAFNEKYGYIKDISIHIKWKNVKKDYGGIFMNTKSFSFEEYWMNPIYKGKKYASYFDFGNYPFCRLDRDIVIWRPEKMLK